MNKETVWADFCKRSNIKQWVEKNGHLLVSYPKGCESDSSDIPISYYHLSTSNGNFAVFSKSECLELIKKCIAHQFLMELAYMMDAPLKNLVKASTLIDTYINNRFQEIQSELENEPNDVDKILCRHVSGFTCVRELGRDDSYYIFFLDPSCYF